MKHPGLSWMVTVLSACNWFVHQPGYFYSTVLRVLKRRQVMVNQ